MADLKMEFENLEQMTRLGKKQLVVQTIKKIKWSRLNESQLNQLAHFANRNHAPILAMRLLHPKIKKNREDGLKIQERTILIYCNSLLNIGSLEEAKNQISKLTDFPEANLTRAFIHFSEWDYQKSIPFLKNYIAFKDLTSYQRQVGKINLVAALISINDWQKAESLISELKVSLAEIPQTHILLGNLLELESQFLIQKQKIEDAKQNLIKAGQLLGEQSGRSLLYVQKWRAVISMLVSPTLEAQNELKSVRDLASTYRNWETIRDCDFHYARLTNDAALLDRIYWGTPFRKYRERMMTIHPFKPCPDRLLIYSPRDQRINPNEFSIDFLNLRNLVDGSENYFKLLDLMTRDIYRPPRMGVVFSHLFQNEYFDPFHSPHRVREFVSSFNQFLSQKHLNLRLIVSQGDFLWKDDSLVPKGICKRIKQNSHYYLPLRLEILKQNLKGQRLKPQIVASILELSVPSASRLLNQWVKSKLIRRIGKGKNTFYLLCR